MNKYQSYKSSGIEWIGEIPEQWDIKKIKELYLNRNERNIESDKTFLSITKDRGVIPYSEKGNVGNKTSDDIEKYKKVYIDDLVINPMNIIIGSVGLSKYNGVLSGVYMVLISHKNFNPKYGSYIFSINSFQKHLKKICYGLMELRESLNKIEFFVEKLPVPILHEQQLIVEFLDSKMELIDMLISTKERKISLLKEQRTSLINQVVTKGLNDNVKMKDSGVEWIGKIPIDWISSKIKHQFMFKGGGTPSTENELYWDGNILWVSPKDMKSKYITDTQDKISQLGLENSSSNLIPPGTLLIVVRSGILQRTIPVSINKTEVSLNQDVKSIQSKGNVLIEFLYYFIKGNENNLLLEWSKVGCTVESIEMEYLNNFQFHFPNLKEQYQIIEHLDLKTKEMDDLIQLEQKKIDLLKEYRQSLISEVVTGKIKVTTDE